MWVVNLDLDLSRLIRPGPDIREGGGGRRKSGGDEKWRPVFVDETFFDSTDKPGGSCVSIRLVQDDAIGTYCCAAASLL